MTTPDPLAQIVLSAGAQWAARDAVGRVQRRLPDFHEPRTYNDLAECAEMLENAAKQLRATIDRHRG